MAALANSQGAAPLLVMTLQSSELTIKQVSALALGDIASTAENAHAICDANGLTALSSCIESLDSKLKVFAHLPLQIIHEIDLYVQKQSMIALRNIASHSVELATKVSDAEIVPKILIHLGHESIHVQKQAARLIQELVKHNVELTDRAVNDGAVGPLVQCLMNSFNYEEDIITPAATCLGYIAGQSPHFANAIVECQGVVALTMLLDEKKSAEQLASCVWALGHIGKHSPHYSKTLADTNAYTKILEV